VTITFTIDLEDPTERYAADGRYVALTRRILALCDQMNRKATFFTVGQLAQAAPQLLQDIASRGHEIAYHSHAHRPLTDEEPERFRRESAEDKDRMEQLTGQKIVGFRAPRFSLTPQSVWALDILRDLGFAYSSSVIPTDLWLFGFPEVPQTPFKWPNGMIEFPLPTARLGKYRIPYLGGIYLYTMPGFALAGFLARAHADEILWTYTHPYDFDSGEKFAPMPHTPLWIAYVLWLARRRAASQIRKILEKAPSAPPLRDRIPQALVVAEKYTKKAASHAPG
jgi:polysaccharide deacetylase family protein (PEP-CTERM system associated)